jgi:hypothetical protein
MIKCQLFCLCEAEAELLDSIFSAILAERGWSNNVRLDCARGQASLVVDSREENFAELMNLFKYVRQVSRHRLKRLGESSPQYFLRSLDSATSEF